MVAVPRTCCPAANHPLHPYSTLPLEKTHLLPRHTSHSNGLSNNVPTAIRRHVALLRCAVSYFRVSTITVSLELCPEARFTFYGIRNKALDRVLDFFDIAPIMFPLFHPNFWKHCLPALSALIGAQHQSYVHVIQPIIRPVTVCTSLYLFC